MTHRYFDAAQGRFLTRDPVGYGGGINLYGFCGNNPVNAMDPEGTDYRIGGFQFSRGQMRESGGIIVAALRNGLTLGHYNGGRYRNNRFYQLDRIPARMAGETTTEIMSMGAGHLFEGARAVRLGGHVTLTEARGLMREWARDPEKGTIAASIKYHYGEHAAGLGSKHVWQYLRQARGFNLGLKNAAKRTVRLRGGGMGIRYTKNGRYIIKNLDGEIVSFGTAHR